MWEGWVLYEWTGEAWRLDKASMDLSALEERRQFLRGLGVCTCLAYV